MLSFFGGRAQRARPNGQQAWWVLSLSLLAANSLSAQTSAMKEAPLAKDAVLVSTARVTVTYSDFLGELARIPEKDRFEFLASRQRLSALVDNIMINKTLAAEARSRGLDKLAHVQAEVQNQVEKVLARHRGQEVISDLPEVDLTPAAREAYLVQSERYVRPKLYETWHVLVSGSGRTPAEAKLLANDLRAKVLDGASLEEIALKHSSDPSAKANKGTLPPVEQRGVAKEYGAAIAKMKIGEVSDVVETQFGYHVIKLISVTPQTRLSFDEVKSELIAEAKIKREDAAFRNHMDALKRDPSFKIDLDALDKIRTTIPDPPPVPIAPIASEIRAK